MLPGQTHPVAGELTEGEGEGEVAGDTDNQGGSEGGLEEEEGRRRRRRKERRGRRKRVKRRKRRRRKVSNCSNVLHNKYTNDCKHIYQRIRRYSVLHIQCCIR